MSNAESISNSDGEWTAEDSALLQEVVSSSGSRLSGARITSSGARFLLARASHQPSKREVLLMIARPDFAQRRDQLSMIADALDRVGAAGIGEVIDRYWPPVDRERWGCLVLTWHKDAITLQKYASKDNTELGQPLIECIHGVLTQVRALHEVGYAHGDLSLGNVLVSPTGIHVSDLEFITNKKFLSEPFETQGYGHPMRMSKLMSSRYSIADAMEWDRFALGQIILKVLDQANPYIHSELTLYNQRALHLIAGLLLGKSIKRSEIALGLDERFFAEEGYEDLRLPIEALERLMGWSSPEGDTPELAAVPSSVVEMGLHRPVPFTDRVKLLVRTSEMQQISSCLQLGLVSFVWPTATHTRLQHAIGTFGMACSAIVNLYADPQSPIFRVLVTPRLARSLLAAALLHDVGHYPLAHDMEEAYPKVFDHEPRSISSIEAGEISRILKNKDDDGWGVNPADVSSIVEGLPRPGSDMSQWTAGMLHSILSGALDIDKLDYLIRDSTALGVAAGGGIDTGRVLSALTVAPVPLPDGVSTLQLRLAVRAKGVRPAELVGRIRSHMFGVAYWHHSYRAIKSMIHVLVWKAVTADTNEPVRRQAELLSKELFDTLSTKSLKPTLPVFETIPIPDAPIPRREAAVLEFLADRGSGSNDPILKLLLSRNWYRAILTVEPPESLEATYGEADPDSIRIWKKSKDILSVPGEKIVPFRLSLQAELQALIEAWLVPRTEGDVPTRFLNWTDKKQQFVVRAALESLILVDFVETRKAVDKPLYFVANEKAGSRMTLTSQALPVRRSYDQRQLQKEFLISNGAIRVFCHPDFNGFLSDSIRQEDLRGMLLAAMETSLSRHQIRQQRARKSQL